MIKLVIEIEPNAQMRARHGRVRTKSGREFTMTYKDKRQRKREDVLKSHLEFEQVQQGIKQLSGALALGVKVFRRIPKSWSGKKQRKAAAGIIRPTSVPDLDNYLKHFKDCANGVLWTDDAQVVEYLPGTGKYYSDRPRWEIEIKPANLPLLEAS